jgi:FkbM family methyltransferase
MLNASSRPVKDEGFQEFECLGLRWRLDMASAISRSMVRTGVWERETTNAVLDLVKPGMRVLAVGANFGYYALLMAQRVGRGGRVWAFEPTLKFREQLNWHVKTNGFADLVTIVPFGLSDSVQSVTIEIMSQSASLHFPPNLPRVGSEVVHLKPLDAVASELGIEKIDFIQMDIDGHEVAFVRGARQTLSTHLPPIAMEFAQSCLHFAGSDVRELAALLRELGYDICSEKTKKPYKNEFEFLLDCGNFDRYSNALAMPRERNGHL